MTPMLNALFPVTRVVLALAIVAAYASSAAAQFRPPPAAAIGENYHVELSYLFWNATPELIISSESLGIPGDDVNLTTDLGIEKKRLRELRVVLRPGRKHKFRFNYTPIRYEAQAPVTREFTFNGLRYRVGLPVNTRADLTTLRGAYEYDFFYTDRGFAGVVLDLKYTNIDVELNSPIGNEFVKSVAPIPGIGFIGRGYVVANVSITGELTYFRVPENLGGEDFGGRYLDFDLYGTFNFTENVGAQVGYRSIDVNYFADLDAGTLKFKGMYFGGVVRF
jgi:hypothetical protein